jgi:hypothetical protein
MLLLEVVTIFLIAVAMSLALAHVLEFPGKRRLSRAMYIAVQPIYYPGFTIGGVSEPLSVIATSALALLMPRGRSSFWWGLAGFAAMEAMQLVFWTVTQPVNRHWLAGLHMTGAGRQFFRMNLDGQQGVANSEASNQWERFSFAESLAAEQSVQQERTQESYSCKASQGGPDRVKVIPFHDQSPAQWTCIIQLNRRKRLVCGMIPKMVQSQLATSSIAPRMNVNLRVIHQATMRKKKADDCQRNLHRKSALIGGLPLSEQGAIVQPETRRLLSEANVECRAREERCDDQRQLSCHHD